MSTVRFGAPLANGTPLVTEAHAYNMDGAIAGWLFFIPSVSFSGVECTSSGRINTSVEPHQQVTRRAARELLRKFAISSLICSASSYLFLAFLTHVPSSLFTYSLSKAAFIGLILERNGFTFARCSGLNTPALAAAS